MKENKNPLENISSKKLREMWEKADDTSGEMVGGFHKGEIWLELDRREKAANGQKQPNQDKIIQLRLPEIGRFNLPKLIRQPYLPGFSDLELKELAKKVFTPKKGHRRWSTA
jgi:hypothetical protein